MLYTLCVQCFWLCYLCSWQTYVLDVHPFNPRIAMSSGYDGKTIVWDVSLQFAESHFILQDLSLVTACIHIFFSLFRFGRAHPSGSTKFHISSWLMESFHRRCLLMLNMESLILLILLVSLFWINVQEHLMNLTNLSLFYDSLIF